jgi:hypothetical protein
MENKFRILLNTHLNLVRYDLNICIMDLVKRSQTHDLDKVFDMEQNVVYEYHFPEIKKLEFGSKEYLNYHNQFFNHASVLHSQNDHHFYSKFNNHTEPNLIDLLEAVIDINVSNKQYSQKGIEETIEICTHKGLFDIDVKEYVYNTLKMIEENN